jgi:hypothetical protein
MTYSVNDSAVTLTLLSGNVFSPRTAFFT